MKKIVLLVLVSLCAGCAGNPLRQFQEDADLLRLEHLEYWSGLAEEYRARTGSYPLQDALASEDEIIAVEILTAQQRQWSSGAPSHFREVPVADLVRELEHGLGRRIEEKYDVQKVATKSPVGYRYFVTSDGYLIWVTCRTCGVTQISTLLMDGHTPTVNIVSEGMYGKVPKALTRDAMREHPVYRQWVSRPFTRKRMFEGLLPRMRMIRKSRRNKPVLEPDASVLSRLRTSWETNAGAWTDAVRSRAIESRRVATDAAIVQAVMACSPRTVLDVGCGEGWLARELSKHNVDVVGIDASLPLIEAARQAGGARYEHCSYEDLHKNADALGAPFDAIACNFALLEEDLSVILATLRQMLRPEGRLLIQTVHPWTVSSANDYQDGWRLERFDGMGSGFKAAMPWYFRTLESWMHLLEDAGLVIWRLEEPRHPETGKPVSLLVAAGRR